jgi:hypothetical protein
MGGLNVAARVNDLNCRQFILQGRIVNKEMYLNNLVMHPVAVLVLFVYVA